MLRCLQKMLCATLVALMLVTASVPALAASVTAKVSSSSARVYKRASQSSSSIGLKKGTKVKVTSLSGKWAKVKKNGHTGYILKKNLDLVSSGAKSKSSSSKSWKSKVVKMNWYSGGGNVLKKGCYGTIYDIDTGVSLRIKRMGGHNHADVEPASSADTVKLLKVAKGSFDWKSHAVILKAGGKYVACAINTMPHGDQTIRTNNYDGQFCLHMCGSKTHGSGKVNSAHQAAIDRAYRWAH